MKAKEQERLLDEIERHLGDVIGLSSQCRAHAEYLYRLLAEIRQEAKRPYEPPAVVSEDTFEIDALACNGNKDNGATCQPPGPFKS